MLNMANGCAAMLRYFSALSVVLDVMNSYNVGPTTFMDVPQFNSWTFYKIEYCQYANMAVLQCWGNFLQ